MVRILGLDRNATRLIRYKFSLNSFLFISRINKSLNEKKWQKSRCLFWEVIVNFIKQTSLSTRRSWSHSINNMRRTSQDAWAARETAWEEPVCRLSWHTDTLRNKHTDKYTLSLSLQRAPAAVQSSFIYLYPWQCPQLPHSPGSNNESVHFR